MKKTNEQVFTCGASCALVAEEGHVTTQLDKALSAIKGAFTKVAHN